MHTAQGHDSRGTQTTLTGPMLAKALKQAKLYENSSKTSETNAGSLKYNNTGAGGVQTTSKNMQEYNEERMINIETRTISTGDYYRDTTKKISIKREREKNASQDITSMQRTNTATNMISQNRVLQNQKTADATQIMGTERVNTAAPRRTVYVANSIKSQTENSQLRSILKSKIPSSRSMSDQALGEYNETVDQLLAN